MQSQAEHPSWVTPSVISTQDIFRQRSVTVLPRSSFQQEDFILKIFTFPTASTPILRQARDINSTTCRSLSIEHRKNLQDIPIRELLECSASAANIIR